MGIESNVSAHHKRSASYRHLRQHREPTTETGGALAPYSSVVTTTEAILSIGVPPHHLYVARVAAQDARLSRCERQLRGASCLLHPKDALRVGGTICHRCGAALRVVPAEAVVERAFCN